MMAFELDNTAAPSDILEVLRISGIAVIRGYLSSEERTALVKEFRGAFTSDDPGVYSVHEHPSNVGGRVARARIGKLGDEEFLVTKKTFSNRFFDELTQLYFDPSPYLLSEDIFFTHEVACDVPILPWHFDREQALKFFIYLTDTKKENGAFEYDPGSHREGHFRANYFLLKGVPQRQIPNDIPIEELHHPQVIEGAAGDLIIFDPDGFHRGGVVQPGQERMVIRGHSHPLPKARAGFASAGWWLKTRLNLARSLGRRVERKIGDRVKSGAKKTRADKYRELREKQ
jgi:hypothetical protein